MSDDIVKQLNELADWIEKHNNVHCDSVIRTAAVRITRLEEENKLFRLQLNYTEKDLKTYLNLLIGIIRLGIYKFKKRWKRT